MFFADSLFSTINQYDLNRTDFFAVLKIISYAQFGNLVAMSQTKLAKDIGIDKANMSRVMKI